MRDDNDVGFQKIIFAVLDGKFYTVRDLAHAFGTSLPTIKRWRDGENAPHPALRRAVLNYIKVSIGCVCPKVCDCQNPPPDDWDGESGGPYHVSNMCPEHNLYSRSDPDCPVHNSR